MKKSYQKIILLLLLIVFIVIIEQVSGSKIDSLIDKVVILLVGYINIPDKIVK